MKEAIKKLLPAFISASLLLIPMCKSNELITTTGKSVEDELKAIAVDGRIPPDLVITYDDMHALWGGATIIISGSGTGKRQERSRGDASARTLEININQDRLIELIRLLIELKAWEQQTPDRQPYPDENRATLTISINNQRSRVWEWFNDLAKNNRIAQIKHKMVEVTEAR